jgi:trigger factor
MQVTETLSDGLRRSYTVVVPAADIETRRAARLSELGRTLRIPGFRPGKVPLSLVRKRYGTAVQAEVFEESVNEATRRVMSDRGLRPAMQPKIDVTSLGADEKADLEFKVDLEVLPEITVPPLGEIQLTRLKAEVPPESVDKALAEIAARNRQMVDLPEEEQGREARAGDILTVDFLGKVAGEPFAGGAGQSVDVEVGGGGFIPGFTEQLAGMKVGDERVIEVTFPEGYSATELAGKAATFDISAKNLRTAAAPAIDDAFAESLGFGGLDEVRQVISSRMRREYDQMSRMKLKRQLLDALSDLATFTAPEGMVEAEFAQIWDRVEADLKAGKLEDDDKDKDEATLRAEYRAIADRRVRLGLLLSEIGRANGVTVGADEMTRAIRAEASRYQGQEKEVMEFFRKNPQAAEGLRGPLFEDKVVDYVLELVQVTDETVTPEELAKAAEA